MARVTIIGGGMAGCELALQLALRDIPVKLVEMRPERMTDAHLTDGLAELVCSNSFRGDAVGNAVGLIKEEMRRAGGRLIALAEHAAVPAGGALAVDRERFSELVQQEIAAQPLITVERREWTALEDPDADVTVIATGPLTSGPLAEAIRERSGEDQLYFYDSIAPIIDAESIDRDIVFAASRYGKGDGDDYLNCPLNKEQYLAFIEAVNAAEMAPVAAFEETKFFEACLPIEVMASRGVDTPRYGPMKPVGITNPNTGQEEYAIIQLRQENVEATAYNMVGFQSRMKWGEQKRIFQQIPGLESAEFLRFGSVHRNTFVHGPKLLGPALEFAGATSLRFAGQITGVEGYVESMATGLILGHLLSAELCGHEVALPPATTALGALRRHVTGELSIDIERFQPSNINWSMFPALDAPRRMQKRKKRLHMATRALADLEQWLSALAAHGLRRPGFEKRDPDVEMVEIDNQPPRKRRARLPQ